MDKTFINKDFIEEVVDQVGSLEVETALLIILRALNPWMGGKPFDPEVNFTDRQIEKKLTSLESRRLDAGSKEYQLGQRLDRLESDAVHEVARVYQIQQSSDSLAKSYLDLETKLHHIAEDIEIVENEIVKSKEEAEDRIDVEIATMRLRELKEDPSVLVVNPSLAEVMPTQVRPVFEVENEIEAIEEQAVRVAIQNQTREIDELKYHNSGLVLQNAYLKGKIDRLTAKNASLVHTLDNRKR